MPTIDKLSKYHPVNINIFCSSFLMCSKNNKSVQIIQESFVVYDMRIAVTSTSDTLKVPLPLLFLSSKIIKLSFDPQRPARQRNVMKVLAQQLPVATGLDPLYKECCVFYQAVIKPLLWDFAIQDFELLMCIQYQSIMGHFSRSLSKLTLHALFVSVCRLKN